MNLYPKNKEIEPSGHFLTTYDIPSEDKCGNQGNMDWIADSGASYHVTGNRNLVSNIKKLKEYELVMIGNWEKMKVEEVGDVVTTYLDNHNNIVDVTLQEVGIVPEFPVNLFSITKAIYNGMELGNEGRIITLTSNSLTLKFDQIMTTARGFLSTIRLIPKNEKLFVCEEEKVMEVNDLHVNLGHVHEASLRITAKEMGISVTGKLKQCIHCGLEKAQKKKMNKEDEHPSKVPGARLQLDISGIETPSLGGSKFWILIVDQYSRYKKSVFVKYKSQLSEEVMNVVRKYRCEGEITKHIRCDNAGGNKDIEKILEKNNIPGISVEFTAPRTPQQN